MSSRHSLSVAQAFNEELPDHSLLTPEDFIPMRPWACQIRTNPPPTLYQYVTLHPFSFTYKWVNYRVPLCIYRTYARVKILQPSHTPSQRRFLSQTAKEIAGLQGGSCLYEIHDIPLLEIVPMDNGRTFAPGVWTDIPLIGLVFCQDVIDVYSPTQFLIVGWRLSMAAQWDERLFYYLTPIDIVVHKDNIDLTSLPLHIMRLPFSLAQQAYRAYYQYVNSFISPFPMQREHCFSKYRMDDRQKLALILQHRALKIWYIPIGEMQPELVTFMPLEGLAIYYSLVLTRVPVYRHWSRIRPAHLALPDYEAGFTTTIYPSD